MSPSIMDAAEISFLSLSFFGNSSYFDNHAKQSKVLLAHYYVADDAVDNGAPALSLEPPTIPLIQWHTFRDISGILSVILSGEVS